jgi:hypothetical protein
MENPFLDEEEERRLGEIVRTALRVRPSAPIRTACPDPEIIRDLAFHRNLAPAMVRKTALHISECYECARLMDRYVLEYRETQADRT